MEAERAANKYKQVEYMQDYVGEEFEAVISGVSNFGFWAETVEHKCEGMVSMTELNTFDDFEMKEGEYALLGRHTGIRFGIGDKVMIRVAAANLDKRQLDYSILELPAQKQAKKRSAPSKPKGDAKKGPKRKR